jgi:hypothetical protein
VVPEEHFEALPAAVAVHVRRERDQLDALHAVDVRNHLRFY